MTDNVFIEAPEEVLVEVVDSEVVESGGVEAVAITEPASDIVTASDLEVVVVGESGLPGPPGPPGESALDFDISKTLAYNADGLLVFVSDALGDKVFVYNSSGRLERVDATGRHKSKLFSYDSNDRLVGVTVL